jgi:hypothetical protein
MGRGILPVVLICRTRVRLPRRANQWLESARLASTRGAYRDRHGRRKRDAMDVSARKTSAADTYGKIVWSWRPDAGVKLVRDERGSDGGYQARHSRESAYTPSNRSCRECRMFRRTCGNCRLLFLLQAGHRCVRCTGIPCALFSDRARTMHDSGISCRGNAQSRPLNCHGSLQAHHPVLQTRST